MQECYQVVFPGQASVIKKGHIELIDISVASRGSNKKVIMTDNFDHISTTLLLIGFTVLYCQLLTILTSCDIPL